MVQIARQGSGDRILEQDDQAAVGAQGSAHRRRDSRIEVVGLAIIGMRRPQITGAAIATDHTLRRRREFLLVKRQRSYRLVGKKLVILACR